MSIRFRHRRHVVSNDDKLCEHPSTHGSSSNNLDIECGHREDKLTELSSMDKKRNMQRRIDDFNFAQRQVRLLINAGVCANMPKTGPITASTSAIYRLLEIQHDIRWVVECEKRRKKKMRAVSWDVFQGLETALVRKGLHPHVHSILFVVILVPSIFCLFMAEGVLFSTRWDQWPLFKRHGFNNEKVLSNQEWHRLLTGIFMHTRVCHMLLNIVSFPHYAFFLVARHGTRKLLLLVGGALLATGLLSTTLAPDLDGMDIRLVFILIGICQADTFVNWDVLTMASHKGMSRRCHQAYSFCAIIAWEFGLFTFSIGFAFQEINQFAHIGGLLYGVCLALPFMPRVDSSLVLGETTHASYYGLQGARVVCFTTAIASIIFLLGLLWSSNLTFSYMPCPRCRCYNSYPFQCRDDFLDNDYYLVE